jgi:hypothetical protein
LGELVSAAGAGAEAVAGVGAPPEEQAQLRAAQRAMVMIFFKRARS